MPILKSAKKALRSSLRKRQVNLKIKNKLKNYLSLFKKNPTKKNLSQVFSALDKAAKKRIIKKEKASRLKSRLSVFFRKKPATIKTVKKIQKSSKNKS